MVICCAICQGRLEIPVVEGNLDGDARTVAIKCGHTFHFVCIRKWWQTLLGTQIQTPAFRVHCPICREENIPEVFNIQFLTADDSLFPPEHEMHETIILELNIEEAQEELNAIRRELDMKNFQIATQEEVIVVRKAGTDQIIKERDFILGELKGQKESADSSQRSGGCRIV